MTARERIDQLAAAAVRDVEHREIEIFGVGGLPRDGVPLPQEDIWAGLAEAGARRALATALASDASLDLAVWARRAHASGMAVSDIAKLGQVTRNTVYQWISDGGA